MVPSMTDWTLRHSTSQRGLELRKNEAPLADFRVYRIRRASTSSCLVIDERPSSPSSWARR